MAKQELKNIILLSIVIFFADASHSVAIPIFPFYANNLGASITIIGLLASSTGLSRMFSSLPFGLLSDRVGRKKVMIVGLLCFILVPLTYNLSSNPYHLFLPRILLGVGMASTFFIGFIYISEFSSQYRNLAQGLYLTSMGIGFTIGPLTGGLLSRLKDYSSSFYLSSGFAVISLILLLFIPSRKPDDIHQEESKILSSFKRVIRNPQILAASTANYFNSLLFITTMIFFPLYGASIGFDESQVGMSITVRSLASTLSRIPTGAVVLKIGALSFMMFGLFVSSLTLIVVSNLDNLVFISIIMGLQGIAYGIFLTSGNVFITEESPKDQHGAAMGVYSTFSNISAVLSPVILGTISEALNIKEALKISALLAIFGIMITIVLSKIKK